MFYIHITYNMPVHAAPVSMSWVPFHLKVCFKVIIIIAVWKYSLFTAVRNDKAQKPQISVKKQENSSSEDSSSEDEKPSIPAAKCEYVYIYLCSIGTFNEENN